MSDARRQARIVAMQTLCQWDVQQDNSPEALSDSLTALQVPDAVADHAASLIRAYWTTGQRVDRIISDAASKWDLSRISPVERNIMRVAVVELLGDEVPAKVALDEAIEIGREFGGHDSPRFLNGVLDAVLKTLQETGKRVD